ncbi:hypothetical protein EST38_g11805 [Candolleomyces aberdarensis]|uniref:Fungal-type protein kinase domain-containing protein n=1 Tax=Candolleomyces aberdarensis TaxID=2316362 RepID=A0A4Q2D691_9AGAR|nr:hypothetical protein EST38_g11805 [Candolleomyces aberdarensis]
MAASTWNATQAATLAAQKQVIVDEIGESNVIPATTIDYFLAKYEHLAKEDRIKKFLRKTELYKKGVWQIPRGEGIKEENLYVPMETIANEIIPFFHVSSNRKALVSSGRPLYHKEDPATDHSSSPDLVIQANGPSFEFPHRAPVLDPSLGYSNAASCLEMKLDKDLGNALASHVPQVEIYSRQMFIQQPNRRFVRILVISENRAGLVHFDRSGAQYTDLIDINKRPGDFIRLILGVSSPDEHLLGLDTTIQWVIGPNGRKKSGTLTTEDADGNEITYDLVEPYPVFNRHSIRGRGTICWTVRDAAGNEFLVKDSWRSEGRESETTFLEKAKGLQGVAQVASFEEDREETASFRGPFTNGERAEDNFYNRWSMRVVLHCYGPPIIHFTSMKHAISALRDAIAGHRNLVHQKQRILHRDISIFNILLGNPGAPKGLRGFLIDLDMAILWDRDPLKMSADCRTGTRMFQSIMVLCAFQGKILRTHDYLDDLEAFFYVLCYLMFCFNGAGENVKAVVSQFVQKWDDVDPANAAAHKIAFLTHPFLPEDPTPYWNETCITLLENFKSFVEGVVKEKRIIYEAKLSETERDDRIDMLHKQSDQHYKRLLGLFDTAIQALPDQDPVVKDAKATDVTSTDSPNGSPLPTPSRSAKSTAKAIAKRAPVPKRSSQEIEEPEEPQVKHPRTTRSVRSKRGAVKPSPLSQLQSESAAQ